MRPVLRAVVVLLLVAVAGACRSPDSSRSDIQSSAPRREERQTPASAQERARAHTELGASYLQIGRLAIAIQELDEALKADANYVPAHSTLGLVYMELREDAKAKASFERALRIDPNDSDANNNYGLFLCDRKREKESLRYFAAALRNPLYATPQEAYVNAGICARRMGDLITAQSYFERALARQPDEERALLNLAQIQFDQGHLNLAKGSLTRYMQRAQQPNVSALWLGARIEKKLGDGTALLSYGTQLKQRFPEAAETRLFSEGRFE